MISYLITAVLVAPWVFVVGGWVVVIMWGDVDY